MLPALAVDGLEKHYGRRHALRGVSLRVEPGELVGLLGPNGAGKSTLVKIACGLTRPSAGTIEVHGHPAGTRAARRLIGYLPEMFRYPDWCTADEVMALHQRLAGSDGGQAERHALLELVGLSEARGRRVEEMSKGMQQRLGLGQALIGAPRLLLLDEPTSALDPAGRIAVREILEELRRRAIAVLLNSHLLSEVERVVDRVTIINRGHTVVSGTPAELARPGGASITTATGVRHFPDATRERVPDLVAELVGAGERIYDVSLLASSLEEVYLRAIDEDAP
ncbi:MAG TPA: ABC transporter ATP-binding protein [Miltoncostaeaceae bacterium]|nr:ABC transporter ATP-binding protein [Miltoncostaeaceae bacterium]